MKFKLLAIILFQTGYGMSVIAQNIPVNLNTYINAAARNNEINGNVLIADQGKVIYKQSFGYSDMGKRTPLTDNSQFPTASVSKTFTAVAVLQLKEKGKLLLDDHLVKYLPRFPYPAITIRQLLSHTSGLMDPESLLEPLMATEPNKVFTNADVIPALIQYSKTKNLPFQPGERWGYSSVGYQLLALLIEKISGEPFDKYLKQHIFLPAGMNQTYVQTSLAQTKEKNRTLNYWYNNHYEMKLERMDTVADRHEWTYNLAGSVGDNNLVSTADDLFKYDQALYSGILLKPATLDEAFTPVKLNNGENNKAIAGTSCGLGWFIFNDTSNGKIVWHSGSNPGVTTLLVRNITKKQTYIILQNLAMSNPVYKDILDIITNKPVTYRQPLGFMYAFDLYHKGADYALSHLSELKADTIHYVLKQEDMDRSGLEFSRSPKLSAFALETYKIITLLFPNSWSTYDQYADILFKRTKDKEAAISLYKRSLQLNPANEKVKQKLDELLK